METISRGPGHHFFGIANVLVTYYLSAPAADTLRKREPWVEQALGEYPVVALLVVVDAAATGALPDSEFRAVSREQGERYRESIACSAVVLESDSIWFGLLRSLLRSLTLVARAPFPVRYFSSVREAAPFVLSACGSTLEVDELVAAVESVRLQTPDSTHT